MKSLMAVVACVLLLDMGSAYAQGYKEADGAEIKALLRQAVDDSCGIIWLEQMSENARECDELKRLAARLYFQYGVTSDDDDRIISMQRILLNHASLPYIPRGLNALAMVLGMAHRMHFDVIGYQGGRWK